MAGACLVLAVPVVAQESDLLAVSLTDSRKVGEDPFIPYSEKEEFKPGSLPLDLDAAGESPELRHWNDLGFNALSHGSPQGALEYFKKAFSVDRKCDRTRSGIGTAFIAVGRYRDALMAYRPMMEKYPNDFILKNNVAWLLATARDPEVRDPRKAIAMAQEALLHNPTDYHIWSTLAEAYYADGQYEKALRAATEMMELAQAQTSDVVRLKSYQEQIIRYRKAVEAFSLVE